MEKGCHTGNPMLSISMRPSPVIPSHPQILAAVLGPILATNTLVYAFEFQRSFTEIAMLTGYNLIGVAVAAPIFAATARVWGRRHSFLLGSVLMIVGSFWAAKATSYKSFLWARIIQGLGIAPFESLIQVVVVDLYFVHQRGLRYAFVAVAYIGAAFLCPILTGVITVRLGWRTSFYFVGGFTTLISVPLFIFCEETAYSRDIVRTDVSAMDVSSHTAAIQRANEEKYYGQRIRPTIELTSDLPQFQNRPSWRTRLSPFSKRYTTESLVKLVVRPFALVLHPAVFWGSATQGLILAWITMLATVVAALFATYPYFFGPEKVGYLYTAPAIAGLLAFPVAGFLSDYLARLLSRTNSNVYEPEFRILLCIPFTLLVSIGLFGFGHTMGVTPYIIPTVFFGFTIASVIFAAVTVGTYFADAYPSLDIDAFTTLLLVKNFVAFALTVRGFDWLNRMGVREMFIICGSSQLAVCALSIPMYIFGKVLRNYCHTSLVVKKLLS